MTKVRDRLRPDMKREGVVDGIGLADDLELVGVRPVDDDDRIAVENEVLVT